MEAYFKHWTGIIPALITPYDSAGNISESAAAALIERLLSKGVRAFYVSGSTGEGFLQTAEERKSFLEMSLNIVNRRVPVIAQVGSLDTNTSLELTRHAERAGADGISVVAPFYYRYTLAEVKRHYLAVAAAADLPLIIYHFPEYTGVLASARFYEECAATENIVGVKFTSRDMFEMQQIIGRCSDDFMVYNGPDECLLAGLSIGCKGAIGSTYNMMPALYVELFDSFRQGGLERARSLQYEANRVIAEMAPYNFIAFVREILRLQGIDTGQARRPIAELTDEQRSAIRELAEKHSCLGIRPDGHANPGESRENELYA